MRLFLSLLLCTALATGCQSGSETPAVADSTATADSAPAPAANSPVTSVEIAGDDQMRFSLTEFTVPAGAEITVTLRNAGSLPKETFGHNFVLLQKDADVEAFLTAAIDEKENDHIPPARQGEVIAHSRLLGPGETDTVTFTAPTEPGTYTYVCSFPGHGTMMRGTMTVVAAEGTAAPADSTTAP
ncbi:MAG TPA: azurin [Rhodothermales bacterium]|nr:azurin [Rhodothermales bacterium]